MLRNSTSPPGRSRGFTLIELMVTIAIAAILITIAVPSFRNLMVSNALTTAANDMVGALNLARMEAIKLNTSTQFCSNSATSNGSDTLGLGCGTRSGAVLMQQIATPITSPLTYTTTQVRDAAMGIQGQVQLASAGITAVRFGGEGLGYQANTASTSTAPYNGPVAVLCSKMISANNVRTIRIATGSIITVDPPSTGTCP